jgi:hypothetical protein
VLGAYRESTVADAAISGSPAITGEEMRRRNLGESAILSPTVGATGYTGVPTPTVEALDYTFSEPWQSSGAIQAYDAPVTRTYEPDVAPSTSQFLTEEDILDLPPVARGYGPDVAYTPQFQMGDPLPEPVDYSAIAPIEDFMGTGASEAAYWSDYLEGARGTRTDDRLTLVGESGPELALFPNGTEIIPLDRKMKPNQAKRLRRRGEFAKSIDSFQFGGYVGEMGPEVTDLPLGAQTMPAGITEMMTGRPTRQPRSLFRQAGMRAPSAQTIANLLPEEIEVYQEMGRLAGIPEKAFEREFRSMVPMGQGGTRQARFTPRGTGRTRYGNR